MHASTDGRRHAALSLNGHGRSRSPATFLDKRIILLNSGQLMLNLERLRILQKSCEKAVCQKYRLVNRNAKLLKMFVRRKTFSPIRNPASNPGIISLIVVAAAAAA